MDAAARPYKVYTAFLTQSGTSAPTATVLENTLGATLSYSYVSEGLYGISASASVFDIDKTVIFTSIGVGGAGFGWNMAATASGATGSIFVSNTSGGGDGRMGKASIEIRVYP